MTKLESKVLQTLRTVRAPIIKTLKPKTQYFLFPVKKNVKPLSSKFGFDRGTPVDRYWIESFLSKNKKHIKGRVLEVTDNEYTKKYGQNVTKSDVLDIDKSNKLANIHADLRNLKGNIKDNTYNCIILTQVLGLVDDYDAALKEIRRILKPGGTLLFTGHSFSRLWRVEHEYWRYTPASTKYIFGKHFGEKNIKIYTYGNALAGQAYWVGAAQNELTKEELEYKDPNFPCLVGARVVKTKNAK